MPSSGGIGGKRTNPVVTPKPGTPSTPANRPATTPAKNTVTTPKDRFEVTPRPDPLAVDRSVKGIEFATVRADPVAVELALRRGADVPGRVQTGPTCGLYALGMVMDYWDRVDSKNLNPLVLKEDRWRRTAYNLPPDTEKTLFDTARQRGYTTQGEMFTSAELGKLAGHFGYRYRTHSNAGLKEIKQVLDRGRPALVAFDVDHQGNPGLYNGKRAHWAVIQGYFEKDGVEYLVATHGWTGKEYVWRAKDFERSMQQLRESDFEGAPADISKTINARVVEVWPK
ncbi:MAG: C39 family peptidase [Myxococcales bacterium]